MSLTYTVVEQTPATEAIQPAASALPGEGPASEGYLILAGEPEAAIRVEPELSRAMAIAAGEAPRLGLVRIFSLRRQRFIAAYAASTNGNPFLI
jgi:hypothetical protein